MKEALYITGSIDIPTAKAMLASPATARAVADRLSDDIREHLLEQIASGKVAQDIANIENKEQPA